MTMMKIVTLVAQLFLSFHGEGHPPHEEHRNDRRHAVAIVR